MRYFDDAIKENPDKEFLVFADEDRSLTYREVDEKSDRFAKWAQENCGVTPGSCVSLVMANCPEFVIVWLAMAKIGAKTALINYNLTGKPLANCLLLAAAESLSGEEGKNVVIYGQSSEESLADADLLKTLGEEGKVFEFWQYTGTGKAGDLPTTEGGHTWHSLDESLEESSEVLSKEEGQTLRQGVKMEDVALYIYTSGTTGLPKAARSRIRGLLLPVRQNALDGFMKGGRGGQEETT